MPYSALGFRMNRVQIEITTKCNLKCFYCAGRVMKQKNMDYQLFRSIIDSLPEKSIINMQGEGEPMSHPTFFYMVDYVKKKGNIPYMITNGTFITNGNAREIRRLFPKIGISIDTLDQKEADNIGRIHLDKTLRGLNILINLYKPKEIDIYTVNYGQDLIRLKEHINYFGLNHIIQPLQQKKDYKINYG